MHLSERCRLPQHHWELHLCPRLHGKRGGGSHGLSAHPRPHRGGEGPESGSAALCPGMKNECLHGPLGVYEKGGLKLNIQKTKIMASGPITSWELHGETVSDFIFWGSKITADGDCSHEMKRLLLLGKRVIGSWRVRSIDPSFCHSTSSSVKRGEG